MSDEDSGCGKFILSAVFLAAFNNPLWQDEKGARQTLVDAGYKPVAVGGYDWFNGLDTYKTKFTATNPQGKQFEGTVTQGLIFTGSVIRFKP
jgi:hypothetical protein